MAGSGPFADDERCVDFVQNLVRMRTMAGWSQPELAARCLCSKGVISNLESFQRAPRIEHGQGIDKAFKLKNMFESKARAIQNQSYPEAFASFPEQEATAEALYLYDHSVISGMLQVERYARAVFETLSDLTSEEIDQKVSARLSRQDALFQEDRKRPRLWALVDEAALGRMARTPAVMHEQCMHLLELSQLPNVSLAVVPYSAGCHIGLSGSCTIVERDGLASIVNLDDLADGRVSDDPVIVKRVALRFRLLQHEAMSNGASRDTISRMAEKWEAQARTGARALTAPLTAASA